MKIQTIWSIGSLTNYQTGQFKTLIDCLFETLRLTRHATTLVAKGKSQIAFELSPTQLLESEVANSYFNFNAQNDPKT
jgi:hypothetical protein